MKGALDRRRPRAAMYVGGMGSESHNFHRDAMARLGFAAEAARVQELWLAGRKAEAEAALPDAFLEHDAFIGDAHRIGERWRQWAPPAMATGLVVSGGVEELRLLARLRDA